MRNGSSDSNFGFILPLGLITVGAIGYFLSTFLITGLTLMVFQWICIIAGIAGPILMILTCSISLNSRRTLPSGRVSSVSGSPPVKRTLVISLSSRMYSIFSDTSLTVSRSQDINNRFRKQKRQIPPQTSVRSRTPVWPYLCWRPGFFV